MTATPHLGLPLLAAAQAQKHVTHNEALYGLDALVQLAVLRRDLALAPASPAEGERYIVAAGAVGAWAGHVHEIAHRQDGLWRYHAPKAGWLAWVEAEARLYAYTGAGWADALGAMASVLQNVERLGIGTGADAANPFSAKLNKALWTARGAAEGGDGDLRLTLNKEAAPDTVSLLFQSGYAGRAEIGLVGGDDFSLKVSADGAAWTEALRVDRATGQVAFPAGAALPGAARNRLINGAFAVNQRGHASGAALPPGAYGHDRWKAGAGGCTYTVVPGTPDTAIQIAAGTLMQVVEAAHVEGGAYTLSWSGSAAARVGMGGAAPSGPYAASPVALTGVAAGQTVAVEFSTGTLGRVQLEPGGVATPFERRPPGTELALCQRYFERSVSNNFTPGWNGYATSGTAQSAQCPFAVEKRVTPTLILTHLSSNLFPAAPGVVGADTRGFYETRTASGTGQGAYFYSQFAASAEL